MVVLKTQETSSYLSLSRSLTWYGHSLVAEETEKLCVYHLQPLIWIGSGSKRRKKEMVNQLYLAHSGRMKRWVSILAYSGRMKSLTGWNGSKHHSRRKKWNMTQSYKSTKYWGNGMKYILITIKNIWKETIWEMKLKRVKPTCLQLYLHFLAVIYPFILSTKVAFILNYKLRDSISKFQVIIGKLSRYNPSLLIESHYIIIIWYSWLLINRNAHSLSWYLHS